VRAWANLYPWDVAGDPAAPDRIVGLGLAGVAACVRAAVDARPGENAGAAAPTGGAELPAQAAGTLLATRAALASRFQREVIAAARDAAPGKPVYLHAHPDQRAMGANPGYEPGALAGAAGIVLSCWDPVTAPSVVTRAAATAPPSPRRCWRSPGWAAIRQRCPPRPPPCAWRAPPNCGSTTPAWPRPPTWRRSATCARPAPEPREPAGSRRLAALAGVVAGHDREQGDVQ
jgi:hypothetical protein